MGSRYEAEVVISSAKDLKNVNWRHGPLRPYAVVWVDPNQKSSTRVDEEGDNCPVWDQTLLIPLPLGPIDSLTLYVDIVHAGREEGTKPLIGSAKLPLRDVIVVGGELVSRSLTLKRPSGRPHGKVEVKVAVREPRYQAPDAHYAPPYGYPVPGSSRDPYAPGPPAGYGAPYGGGPPNYGYGAPAPAPIPQPYYGAAPPSGYPAYGGGYGAPPPVTAAYGQPSYGGGYGQNQPSSTMYVQEEKKKSKLGGMGTGLAVGAVAGALGGLALAEGFDALEDKIADDAAEKVEDDLGYDDDDF